MSAAGEITGLIGHNGAGKTTFMEVVTGLVRPDPGQVTVGGIDARRKPRAARRLLGLAPQELALYLTATVRDNLRLFGALAGLSGGPLRRAVDDIAEELMLTDVLGQRAGLLSGGQRRRTQAGDRPGRRRAAAAAGRADGGRRPADPRGAADGGPGAGRRGRGRPVHHPLPAGAG